MLNASYGKAYYSNTIKSNKYFVGREAEMQMIKDLLAKNDRAILVGGGGIGKTQIAKAYLLKHLKDYDILWWIDAEKSVKKQLINLSREINEKCSSEHEEPIFISTDQEDESIKSLMEKLQNTNIKWLIVLDNVKNITDASYLINIKNKNHKGHWIVTTRDSNASNNVINVNKFKRTESLNFLSQLENSEHNKQEINQLAEMLEDYPLALAQAFTYISVAPSINVGRYIKLYKQRQNDIMDVEFKMIKLFKGGYTDRYNKTIKVVTSLILDEIKKESEGAYRLLGIISVLNTKNIPESIIYGYFNDEIEASESLSHLLRYSILIKNNKNTTAKDDNLYTIHELTQSIIRDSFTSSEIKRFLKEAARALCSILPNEREEYFPVFINKYYILDHINFINMLSKDYALYSNELFKINLKKLEYTLVQRRDFPEAKTLIEELNNNLSGLKTDELDKARLLLTEATYYTMVEANYKKSIHYVLKASELLKKHKFTYENVIKCCRLAQNYAQEGDFDKMMMYVKEGEEILSQTNIKAYDYQGPIEQCKTRMYIDQGNLQMALKSVGKREKINSLRHPSIREIDSAYNLWDKARILLAEGKYEDIKNITKEIKRILNTYYKKAMYLTPIPNLIMAHYYLKTSHLSKAAAEAIKGLELFNKVSRSDRSKAFMYKTQGDIFTAQKKHKQAMDSYLEAEKIYDNILINKAIADVSELYEALVENSINMRDPMRAYHYRDKHLDIFGGADPRSIRLWNKVADAENRES